ncbi:MAG: RNA 2',3'-cyclic phosphodiesterase [Dehalococcoidales bacterium]|nr:RNA 2',3'-cyclic phosphodiesterase [Dehalococcoidales bacterium]
MPLVRCFIAIELPVEVKNELAGLIHSLKNRSLNFMSWVDPKGIHITLKFLGEVSQELIPDIEQSMEDAAQQSHPFQLGVSGTGAFPNLNRPELIWVGVNGEMDKLNALQKNIDINMEMLGFPREKKPYTPHLTLARVRIEAPDFDRQRLGKLLAATSFTSALAVKVTGVHLIKSQLTPTGPIYTVMKTSRLS